MFSSCSAKRRASDKDLPVKEVDPYGWFMWYCRFYLGRRCEDDERQIGRWKNCTGPKGKRILFGIIQKKNLCYLNPVYHDMHWLKMGEKK